MSCFLCPVAHFILTRMEDYLRTILETKRLAIFERWTLDHVYSLSYRDNNEQVSLPYPLSSETPKSTSHARDNMLYTCPPSTRNNVPVTIFRLCTPLGVFCAYCTIKLWREYKDVKKSHVGHLQHEIVWFPETKRPAPLKLQCEVTPNFAHRPEGNNNRKQTLTPIKRRQHLSITWPVKTLSFFFDFSKFGLCTWESFGHVITFQHAVFRFPESRKHLCTPDRLSASRRHIHPSFRACRSN